MNVDFVLLAVAGEEDEVLPEALDLLVVHLDRELVLEGSLDHFLGLLFFWSVGHGDLRVEVAVGRFSSGRHIIGLMLFAGSLAANGRTG